MSTSRQRFVLRAGALATLTSAAALLTAGLASAHVTVDPGEAPKGGYPTVNFRVPNESDTAGTVKLEVTLPAEYKLKTVRAKPVPGWKLTVAKTKDGDNERISTITWQADAGVRINPDEFGLFPVILGKLPENTDKVVLPTVQTYDDGKVVKWDAPPPAAGAEEPEYPAPVLALGAKAADGHGHGGAATPSVSAAGGHTETKAAAGEDTAARWLGGAGLAVGALGLGFGVGAILRSRRSAA
ncbi:uncharacterized protein YcnI [Crossiella equi]|uniref:Uncharacterized protein YcnI n=1 Tax=Crossiella equi TaxID=130796 RepID=A0ABS5AFY2_9PSEU|nr:YcnI family protein [Crossiella equi]MBP2475483.1 uncharacterized protein YcnI [Crossiella equi]